MRAIAMVFSSSEWTWGYPPNMFMLTAYTTVAATV
jgi:hypothetical protein